MPLVFNRMSTNWNIEKLNVFKMSIGTMHLCFRLAKKPALRKKAATSSLGDKDILYPYSSSQTHSEYSSKDIFIPIRLSDPSRIFFKGYFLSLLNPQTQPEYSSKDILYSYSTLKPIQNILQNLNGFHKVRPGRSLPLLLLSLLHLWSGKSFLGKHPKHDYQVNPFYATESRCLIGWKRWKGHFVYRRKKIVSTAIVGQV